MPTAQALLFPLNINLFLVLCLYNASCPLLYLLPTSWPSIRLLLDAPPFPVVSAAAERGVAFLALSDMATSLASLGFGPGFESCLPAIAAQIQETIAASRGVKKPSRAVQCPEALDCVGSLSQALGTLWLPYAAQLLDAMMLTGLSPGLVSALMQVLLLSKQIIKSLMLDAGDVPPLCWMLAMRLLK